MPRRHTPARAPQAVLVACVALFAPPLSAPAGALAAGEALVVSGYVSDAEGRALADLPVVLEAARTGFSVRTMRMETGRTERVETLTGADGRYAFEWSYDPFYNHFEIRVLLPTSRAGEEPRILARRELTDQIQLGSPVVANLTVDRAGEIARVRGFEASVDTPDEERIFARHGRPDHVRTVRYPEVQETSWWFFEAGVVYYLRGGNLVETRRFEPVRPE